MNKESIYFSHDADAMNDPKCMLLIEQFGMEGYGAFWGLVEMLRVQPNYRLPLSLIPAISKRFSMSEAKIKTIIENYGLFDLSEDTFFFSKSLRDRMQIMAIRHDQKRLAGIKSGEVRRLKALLSNNNERCSNGVQTELERSLNKNEQKKRKEKKEEKEISPLGDKKKKSNNFFTPPTVGDVKLYCKERGNSIDPEHFIDWYTSKNWMIGKNKMKDWKAAVRTWEKLKKEQSQSNQKQNEEAKRYGLL